jgi:MFS family permease
MKIDYKNQNDINIISSPNNTKSNITLFKCINFEFFTTDVVALPMTAIFFIFQIIFIIFLTICCLYYLLSKKKNYFLVVIIVLIEIICFFQMLREIITVIQYVIEIYYYSTQNIQKEEIITKYCTVEKEIIVSLTNFFATLCLFLLSVMFCFLAIVYSNILKDIGFIHKYVMYAFTIIVGFIVICFGIFIFAFFIYTILNIIFHFVGLTSLTIIFGIFSIIFYVLYISMMVSVVFVNSFFSILLIFKMLQITNRIEDKGIKRNNLRRVCKIVVLVFLCDSFFVLTILLIAGLVVQLTIYEPF